MTITKRAPRLSFKTIGEETIVLDTKINKEVHKLDEVGTFIWNLLDGNRSINQICDLMVKEYEVNAEQCSKDLNEFVEQLKSKNLLEIVE